MSLKSCVFFFTLSVMGSVTTGVKQPLCFSKSSDTSPEISWIHLVKIGWCNHLLFDSFQQAAHPIWGIPDSPLRCGTGSLSPVSSLACPRHRQLCLVFVSGSYQNKAPDRGETMDEGKLWYHSNSEVSKSFQQMEVKGAGEASMSHLKIPSKPLTAELLARG